MKSFANPDSGPKSIALDGSDSANYKLETSQHDDNGSIIEVKTEDIEVPQLAMKN